MAIRRAMRRTMRERAFRLARHDLAMFLRDHEEELMQIFHEELQRLDDEIPEENFFIDIKMVPLGEMIVKAVLRAMDRFLTGDAMGNTAVEQAANITPDSDPIQRRRRKEEKTKHLSI
jgi:hypothetical protein